MFFYKKKKINATKFSLSGYLSVIMRHQWAYSVSSEIYSTFFPFVHHTGPVSRAAPGLALVFDATAKCTLNLFNIR